jgi:hypothetical protein
MTTGIVENATKTIRKIAPTLRISPLAHDKVLIPHAHNSTQEGLGFLMGSIGDSESKHK